MLAVYSLFIERYVSKTFYYHVLSYILTYYLLLMLIISIIDLFLVNSTIRAHCIVRWKYSAPIGGALLLRTNLYCSV